MGWGEWLLAGLVALVFAFVILRPDLWRRTGSRRNRGDGGTSVGVDGTGRRDRDDDNDGDGGSDGGGDGGGGD